jgi:hypothetical protein
VLAAPARFRTWADDFSSISPSFVGRAPTRPSTMLACKQK